MITWIKNHVIITLVGVVIGIVVVNSAISFTADTVNEQNEKLNNTTISDLLK